TRAIDTLSLHDALPIWEWRRMPLRPPLLQVLCRRRGQQLERRPLPRLVTYPEVREWRPGCWNQGPAPRLPKSGYAHAPLAVLARSEEHTSELQSRGHLV